MSISSPELFSALIVPALHHHRPQNRNILSDTVWKLFWSLVDKNSETHKPSNNTHGGIMGHRILGPQMTEVANSRSASIQQKFFRAFTVTRPPGKLQKLMKAPDPWWEELVELQSLQVIFTRHRISAGGIYTWNLHRNISSKHLRVCPLWRSQFRTQWRNQSWTNHY